MTAQEIIEKIRTEIENRQKELMACIDNKDVFMGKERREMLVAYEENSKTLSILSDLEKECEKPTTAEDLEKEIEGWFNRLDNKYCRNVEEYYGNDIEDTARHFYELGRQSKKTEWTERDIENGSYISAFLQANCGDNVTLKEATLWFMSRLKQLPIQQNKPEVRFPHEKDIVDKVFGAGNLDGWEYDEAKALVALAKEELMKEAVEGIVTTRSMAGNIVTAHIDHQFKDGQKVPVIIVKEDEK